MPVSPQGQADGVPEVPPLLDHLPDVVARFDRDLRHVYVNARAVELTGLPRENFLGRTNRELGMPEPLVRLWDEAIRSVFATGRVRDFRFSWGDGRILQSRAVPEPGTHGIVEHVNVVTRDVTDLERARRQAERLTDVLNSISDAFVVFDADWRYAYFNQVLLDMFDLDAGALQGRSFWETYPELKGTAVEEAFLRVAREGSPEWFRFDFDDSGVRAEIGVYPVSEGVAVLIRDVGEQVALEESLAQAQRLEGLGRLAGGVAHDFNNLLTAIDGYAELALAELDEAADAAPAVRDILQEIVTATGRAAELTRQLLVFSRRQHHRAESVDLRDAVDGLVPLLRRLIGDDVSVEVTHGPSGDATVVGDRSQFEQVLMNLAVNARDAMPEGGRLSIHTERVQLSRSAAAIVDESLEAGDYVELEITDTGQGMDEATARRALEPFFSTKPAHEGTGLGLSTVYGIVRQHGGGMRLSSAPERGTRVTVYLPATDAAPEPVEPPAASTRVGGTEHVLLVEDHPDVRELVARVLRRAGYVVTTARSPVDALRCAERTPFDLLLTDLIMPGMRGYELIDRLRARRPTLRAIVMSGYSGDKADAPTGAGAFLPKPFSPDELLAVVRAELDA